MVEWIDLKQWAEFIKNLDENDVGENSCVGKINLLEVIDLNYNDSRKRCNF